MIVDASDDELRLAAQLFRAFGLEYGQQTALTVPMQRWADVTEAERLAWVAVLRARLAPSRPSGELDEPPPPTRPERGQAPPSRASGRLRPIAPEPGYLDGGYYGQVLQADPKEGT